MNETSLTNVNQLVASIIAFFFFFYLEQDSCSAAKSNVFCFFGVFCSTHAVQSYSNFILTYKMPLSPAHKHQSHKDSQHSQGFFVVLSVHSESKGVLCDLQCVADRAGWVTVDAEDVFMIDLEPLLLGIKDLRENNQLFRHRQPA